jgi:Leucine-rich repeat (LRR) protein
MTISSITKNIYIICPICGTDTNLAAQPTCEKCGYEVPSAFIIPPDAKWDYEPEHVKFLKSHDSLRLMGRYAGEHPEKIKELNHVKYLYLSRYPEFSFSFLEHFNQLEVLELNEIAIENLQKIDMAMNLQSLSIMECDSFESLSGISTSKFLKILDITACKKFKYFEGVQTLSQLIYFRYEGKNMESIGFLAGLKNLKVVALPTKVLDRKLDAVLGLPNLEKLCIRKNSFDKATIQNFSQAKPDCKLVLW